MLWIQKNFCCSHFREVVQTSHIGFLAADLSLNQSGQVAVQIAKSLPDEPDGLLRQRLFCGGQCLVECG